MALDVNDKVNGWNLTNNGSVAELTTGLPFAASSIAADLGTSNSTKYLSLADDFNIGGNSDMSIEFWIKLQTEIASGFYTIFMHESTSGADRYLDCVYEYNAGTRRLNITAGQYTITLGTTSWYHLAITRSIAGNTILYVDGVAQITAATSASGMGAAAARFTAGAHPNPTNYSSAIIDDLRIWNDVRTSTEINDNKSIELAGNEAGLIAYYPFESLIVTNQSYAYFM